MTYPETINLELKGRHFDGSFHHDRINGAICKCIRELYPNSYINNNECDTVIDKTIYLHPSFDESDHNACKIVAERLHFNDSIITNLILTKE